MEDKKTLKKVKDGDTIIKIGDTTTVTVGAGQVYSGDSYVFENCWIKTKRDRIDFLYILLNELDSEGLFKVFNSCLDSYLIKDDLEEFIKSDRTLGHKQRVNKAMISALLGNQYVSEEIITKVHHRQFFTDYSYLTDNYKIINCAFRQLETLDKIHFQLRNERIKVYNIKNTNSHMSGFNVEFTQESRDVIKLTDYENYY